MALTKNQLMNLASCGAAAVIADLNAEIAAIEKAFPEVRAAAAQVSTARGRRKMSAAARKAVSARMKRYWAARKSAKK